MADRAARAPDLDRRTFNAAAGCRRAHRGSDQAGLSRDPRAPRTHTADSVAAAGAGAVVVDEGMKRIPSLVVPAKAGIHKGSCFRKSSTRVPQREAAAAR